jgi:hypothetical protein
MQKSYAHPSILKHAAAIVPDVREVNHDTGYPSVAEAPVQKSQAQLLPPARALGRIIAFFVLVVALIFLMNALISAGLRQIKTSSYGAWNQVMQGQVNADVIISGSSRATYHYDPRAIEAATGRTAFNIGRAGTQTDVQLAVLKAYLEHNRKPQLVIHNLDAFTFVSSHAIYDPALYVPYLGDKDIYNPLRSIDPELVKSRYIPLYGYVVDDMNFTWIEGLKALAGINPKQDYYLGFSPRPYPWGDDFSNFQTANPNGVSFSIEPSGVDALKGLLQLCHDDGIPLILVYSPEYRGMQQLTNNRAEIFARFRQLADQYQVPLWDYSNWPYDSNQNYFYNSQHLNATGAALFSDELAKRLKTYFSESQATANDFGTSKFPTHADAVIN